MFIVLQVPEGPVVQGTGYITYNGVLVPTQTTINPPIVLGSFERFEEAKAFVENEEDQRRIYIMECEKIFS
ncbi:MAG: hypothetical protein P4L69_11010 [Desulfosporosinus sp.]|nr:hypothetical protein [Desulfosporosinus sp.]